MSSSTERRVGSYILGPTLGKGGFSKVKLGTHVETGAKVALKILKRDHFNINESTRRQVEREIRAMENVQHKHVVRLIEVDWDCVYPKKGGTTTDVVLVVLELATGGELFEFLSYTGCFEETVARTYFQQLIEGVEACHAHGIAHRDLKPENLLLDAHFVLKLADFGFAHLFAPSARTMFTECGTPGYMAPEMFRINNMQGYDATKCDVWACGVVLFIMLAGFPPFQKPSDDDWWFNKLNHNKHALFWQAHSRSACFSDSVKDLINKILSTDPAKRITLSAIKRHEWYSGDIISSTDLHEEMSRRKVRVDEERRRAKPDRKMDDVHVAGRGVADYEATRGVPDMPIALPAFSATQSAVLAASNLRNESAVDALLLAASGSPPLAPRPYVPDSTVSCYTRFETTQQPKLVLLRICDALSRLSGRYSVVEAEYRIKSVVVMETGPISFRAQICTRPTASVGGDAVYVCEFRRVTGDSIQYISLYNSIEQLLDDLILRDAPVICALPTSKDATAVAIGDGSVAQLSAETIAALTGNA